MRDDEYLAAFERGEVRNEDFRHRDHLRLAWGCIRQAGSESEACERICRLIRDFAAAAGHAAKFDEALTVSWMRRLWQLRAQEGDVPFAAMIAHNPAILDKDAHAAEAHSRAAQGDPRRGPVPRAA